MSQITNLGPQGGSATGDVVGPASATNNAIALFDGTSGKLIKNSVVLVDGSGNMTGVAGLSAVSGTFSGLTANRHVITGASGVLQTPFALTNGQLAIGSTGAQPAAGAITSLDGSLTVTLGAGTINITVAGSGGGATGTGSTVGAVTADVITFPLGATPGTYSLEVQVSGFDAGTPAGIGVTLSAAVRTDGAAATLISTPDKVVLEEAALVGATADVVVAANTAIVRVTGVAAITLNWVARLISVKAV